MAYIRKAEQLRLEAMRDALAIHGDIVSTVALDGKKAGSHMGRMRESVERAIRSMQGMKANAGAVPYEQGALALKEAQHGGRR